MADIDREKLIDKISKLKAKAERTENPSEADAFMAKVVRMMEEHAIEERELATQLQQIGPTTFKWKMKYYCGWQRILYGQIAGSFGCCFTYVPSSDRVTTYGREDRAHASVQCHNDVTEQILRYSRILFPGDRGKQRRAEAGLGYGVGDRIREIRESSRSNGRALILNDEREAEEFLKQLRPDLKTTEVTQSVTTEFVVGYQNAGAIEVNKQVKR
jgi:hypothetical protein